MKIVARILSYVLVAVIAATVAVACTLPATGGTEKLSQLKNMLMTRFIGEAEEKKLEDAAASAMVGALGDRWSYYMTAEDYQSYLETMSNSYVGVGITITPNPEGLGFDIIEVTPNAPAQTAGVAVGDILTAVDGTSVEDMDNSELGTLVRGKEGTSVKLTVQRGEETLEFTVVRKKFQTPVATCTMLENNIGLITIENFDSRCAEETIAAVKTMTEQGANALLFDVRNNPGGYKDELVKVLNYLLPEGELFRTEDYLGRESVDYSDADCVKMPMAVLVNLHSYSAAEFFAAALMEYDAAVVVGEKTYGKGYFQTTYALKDGSAVNLSIGKYYTPKGNSLAGVGIQPDVVEIVDAETAAAISAGTLEPSQDPQIQAAIEALSR